MNKIKKIYFLIIFIATVICLSGCAAPKKPVILKDPSRIIYGKDTIFVVSKIPENYLESKEIIPNSEILSKQELELYHLIMDYRKTKGLPSIPLSKSLTVVAQTHAKDLYENLDKLIRYGGWSGHSWSDKGSWSPIKNYNGGIKHNQRARNKPRELTSYKGDGYDIVCVGTIFPVEILYAFQRSPLHNNLIISQGDWRKYYWRAIGISIYKDYTSIWFGERKDKWAK